jgi:hypothetical protein
MLLLDDVESLLASTSLVVDVCRHACATDAPSSPWKHVLCCSCWRARWRRRGQATSEERARRAGLPGEARRRVVPRTAPRRDRAASLGTASAGHGKRDEGRFALAPHRLAKSSCSRRQWKTRMRRRLPCWPMAKRGRAPRWHSRWERASAPHSARSMRWRPQARCSRSVAARARRWITSPVPGFPTTLLLPAPLPSD